MAPLRAYRLCVRRSALGVVSEFGPAALRGRRASTATYACRGPIVSLLRSGLCLVTGLALDCDIVVCGRLLHVGACRSLCWAALLCSSGYLGVKACPAVVHRLLPCRMFGSACRARDAAAASGIVRSLSFGAWLRSPAGFCYRPRTSRIFVFLR